MENRIAGNKELTPVQLMNKAIQALYLEVPNSVANDVSQKWIDAREYLLRESQPIPKYVDGLKKLLRIANCPEILIEYPDILNSSRTAEGLKWAEEAMRRYESAQPDPIPVNQKIVSVFDKVWAQEIAVDFAWENIVDRSNGYQRLRKQFTEWLDVNHYHKNKFAAAQQPIPVQEGLDFGKWIEENTQIYYDEKNKLYLYRYFDNTDGWGNYILEDIYTVFKDKYESPVQTEDEKKEM